VNQWIFEMYTVSFVGALAAMFWPVLLNVFRNGPSLVETYRIGKTTSRVAYFAAAVAIALVVSALGFFAFGQAAIKDELQALGALAYFSAFTYGFSAGSAIEEPLKKK